MTVVEHDRIIADPETLQGRPRIRGTRITADRILDDLGHGASIEDILGDYPHLIREDVLAALRLAADWLPLGTSLDSMAAHDGAALVRLWQDGLDSGPASPLDMAEIKRKARG